MAYLNVKSRSLETKIVYYGAGLSGKTTNLEIVKKHSEEGRCGEMMSLNTAGDRTLFFDWVPFNMGKVNGCDVKMQLYTVPGQAKYAETRRRVLAGADGIVLVLDSQSSAVERNLEIMADLREQMAANHLATESCPIVVQLNKRDLPNAMRVEDLVRELSLDRLVTVEAVAATGQGVFETLREASRLVLAAVRRNAREDGSALSAGDASGLDGQTLYASLTASNLANGVAVVEEAVVSSPLESSATTPAPATSSMGSAPSEPSSSTPGPATSVTGPATSVTGAAMAVPASAPTSAPATSPSRASSPSSGAALSIGVASVVPSPGGAPGFGELLAGVRALSLRFDALEPALARASSTQNADLERRLAARVEQVVDAKIGALGRTVAGTIDATDAQLAEMGSALVGLTIRAERAEKAAEDASEVAARLLAGIAGLTEDVQRRFAEASAETERRFTSATSDAARRAAEAEERSSQELASLREVIFRDAAALAERQAGEQKAAQQKLLEPLANLRAILLDEAAANGQRDETLRGLSAAIRTELDARLGALVTCFRQDLSTTADSLAAEVHETSRGLLDDRLGVLAVDLSARATSERTALEKRLGHWLERVPDVGAIKLVVQASLVEPLVEVDRRLLTLAVAGAECSEALGALRPDLATTVKDVRGLAATVVKAFELQKQGVEEVARDLRQAERNLGQRIESVAPEVTRAIAPPLAQTGETIAAAVAGVRATVAAGLTTMGQGLSVNESALLRLREELCHADGKTLPQALEDVRLHAHNHFTTVEDGLRRVGEELHRASADAKGRAWWKG